MHFTTNVRSSENLPKFFICSVFIKWMKFINVLKRYISILKSNHAFCIFRSSELIFGLFS